MIKICRFPILYWWRMLGDLFVYEMLNNKLIVNLTLEASVGIEASLRHDDLFHDEYAYFETTENKIFHTQATVSFEVNWWRNVSRETQKLLDFIKQIEATKSYDGEELAKTALAFTDDIAPIENHMSQTITFQ